MTVHALPSRRLPWYLLSMILFLCLVSQGNPPGAWAAEEKIAYVDLRQVMIKSLAGVQAREQIEKEKAAMQKEIDTKREEVERVKDELDKKALLLAPDVKKDREEQLQRKIRDLRRLADDLQKELERKDQLATQKILQEVVGVIQRYGKQHGYLVIFDRSGAGVIYGALEADLTSEIIKVYDQEKAREKK